MRACCMWWAHIPPYPHSAAIASAALSWINGVQVPRASLPTDTRVVPRERMHSLERPTGWHHSLALFVSDLGRHKTFALLHNSMRLNAHTHIGRAQTRAHERTDERTMHSRGAVSRSLSRSPSLSLFPPLPPLRATRDGALLAGHDNSSQVVVMSTLNELSTPCSHSRAPLRSTANEIAYFCVCVDSSSSLSLPPRHNSKSRWSLAPPPPRRF